MMVKNREEAWKYAKRLFPGDYEKDAVASSRAGYPIYRSASDSYRNDHWISDLGGSGLELNMGSETIRIHIVEEEKAAESKPCFITATIRSLSNKFRSYDVARVVSVQVLNGITVLTSLMEDGKINVSEYNGDAGVLIELHA